MQKILIIGSKGMLGHILKKYLESLNKYEIFATHRNEKDLKSREFLLNVFDTTALNGVLEKIKPDFVVNCAGILNKTAEENPDIAIFVNGYIPHYLDKMSIKYNYKLIHITTDCVFSGKTGNYKEDDFKDATSYYGMSKSIGEVNNNKTFTIRTSIIGPDENPNGIGLFNWFINQKGTINGYTNVFWSGVTTLELSKAIEYSFNKDVTGIYHLTNGIKISKYDLLKLIQKQFDKKDVEIIPYDNYFSDKSLVNTRKDFDFNVKNYELMIKEMYEYIIFGFKISRK